MSEVTHTRRHMCMNIAGALRNAGKRSMAGLLTDDYGVEMSDKKVREYLAECLEKGWRVIPSSDCEGFDYQTGCPGHVIEQKESSEPEQDKKTVVSIGNKGLEVHNAPNPFERIGTFCEKCRQVVCICHEVSVVLEEKTKTLDELKDEFARTKGYADWETIWLVKNKFSEFTVIENELIQTILSKQS